MDNLKRKVDRLKMKAFPFSPLHLKNEQQVHHAMTFFFKTFFLMWTIFKVFIEFVTILLLFYVLVFLAMRHVGS